MTSDDHGWALAAVADVLAVSLCLLGGLAIFFAIVQWTDTLSLGWFLLLSSATWLAGFSAGYTITNRHDSWYFWAGVSFTIVSFFWLITLGFLLWWPSLLTFGFGAAGRARRR